jgi:hypothetical protein
LRLCLLFAPEGAATKVQLLGSRERQTSQTRLHQGDSISSLFRRQFRILGRQAQRQPHLVRRPSGPDPEGCSGDTRHRSWPHTAWERSASPLYFAVGHNLNWRAQPRLRRQLFCGGSSSFVSSSSPPQSGESKG